jgi:hypothetical protein
MHEDGVRHPLALFLVLLSVAKRFGLPTSEPVETTPSDAEEDEEEGEGVPDAVFVHLMVEVMGRHSNLILVDDDGLVMESAKRVTLAMSRVRPVVPKAVYIPPPAQEKEDPRRVTTETLGGWLGTVPDGQLLARALPGRFRGMSPQLAREVAFLATGSAAGPAGQAREADPAEVARAIRRLYEPLLTGAWEPSVYLEDEAPVAFSPIPLAHLTATHDEQRLSSISACAEAVREAGATEAPRRHGARIARLSQEIAAAREKLTSRLASLQAQERRLADAEQWRSWGELIYGYLWKIQPGDAELDADGVRVPLDPERSPKEVAQSYLQQYRDAQSGGEHIRAVREATEAELAYLEQLATLVAQAESYEDIEALETEWRSSGLASMKQPAGKRPRSAPPKRPRPVLQIDGVDLGQAIRHRVERQPVPRRVVSGEETVRGKADDEHHGEIRSHDDDSHTPPSGTRRQERQREGHEHEGGEKQQGDVHHWPEKPVHHSSCPATRYTPATIVIRMAAERHARCSLQRGVGAQGGIDHQAAGATIDYNGNEQGWLYHSA